MGRGRPVELRPALAEQIAAWHEEFGLGARDIAAVLERSGVTAPHGGRDWHASTVSRTLRARGAVFPRGRPPATRLPAPDRPTALRIVTRRAYRRRAPGSGSALWELLDARDPSRSGELIRLAAAFGGVECALIGAVACNQYMPARQTADVDVVIRERDAGAATRALLRAGWAVAEVLQMRAPFRGQAWRAPDIGSVDVVVIPGPLGDALVDTAQRNCADGVPTATLPYLVVLKQFAGRAQDAADISRMLGHQDTATTEALVQVASRFLHGDDIDDIRQLIELGRREFQRRPPSP